MPPLTLRNAYHIGLQVTDVEAALAFYLRTFASIGMRNVMRFRNWSGV
jgi:hypothetical protein